jgi:hypothetical protein
MNTHLETESAEFRLLQSGIYLGSGFYEMAETLRSQFERAVLDPQGRNGGMTPLSYAYFENGYQFLTASAERLFTKDVVDGLIDRLRRWGNVVLGVSHVSTPQVRVYFNQCSRNLLRDNVSAPWHFILSITLNHRQQSPARIKILKERIPRNTKDEFSVDMIVNSALDFNQLLVHSTRDPYSVGAVKTSMNPLEGTVLLDGYLW